MIPKNNPLPVISDDYPPILVDRDEQHTLASRFREKAQQNPDYTILEVDGETFTYQQLDERTNQIANTILSHIAPDNPQPIIIIAETNKVIGLAQLGVIKSGHFFAVLSTLEPIKYLQDISGLVEPALILVDTANITLGKALAEPFDASVINLDEISLDSDTSDPNMNFSSERLFCITFTSGSTGQSKGVLATHYDWFNLVADVILAVPATNEDTELALVTLRFGAGVVTFLCNLLRGTRLLLVNSNTLTPIEIADLIDREQVKTVFAVASQLRQVWSMLPEGRILSSLRIIMSGGEASYAADFDLWKAHTHPDCVQNIRYGTSEVGFMCYGYVRHASVIDTPTIPVGYSYPYKDVWVADDDLNPVPNGELGEIIVRGKFAKVGYWKRPDLTAKVVIQDPDTPELTIYRTNDLGKVLPDGRLLHMGRKNFEVKLRGYRIDLVSIESHLRKHPQVTDCAMMVRQDEQGNQKLISYYVLRADANISVGDLRQFMTQRLPTYMIPHYFVELDELPKTEIGKLNRNALPELTSEHIKANQIVIDAATYALPYTPTQHILAEIWQKHLNTQNMSIHAKWLDMGGDSLMAMNMIIEVSEALQQDIPTVYISRAETIAEFAALVDGVTEQSDNTILMRDNGDEGVLFFPYLILGNLSIYQPLIQHMNALYQYVGIQPPYDAYSENPSLLTIPEIAAYCIDAMRTYQPDGVYNIVGYSFAAKVAYEIAYQLRQQRATVGKLIILDTNLPKVSITMQEAIARRWYTHGNNIRAMSMSERVTYLSNLVLQKIGVKSWQVTRHDPIHDYHHRLHFPLHLQRLELHHIQAVEMYQPEKYRGDAFIVQTYDAPIVLYKNQWYWRQWIQGNVEFLALDAHHFDILHEPHVQTIAQTIDRVLTSQSGA